MSISNAVDRAAIASVALAMLAGCSGGSLTAATPVGQTASADTKSAQEQAVQGGRNEMGIWLRKGSIVSGLRVTTPSFLSPDAVGKPLLFVADDTNNVVDIYRQAHKKKMVGQITGLSFPAVATDTGGRLYIANSSGSAGGNVLIYTPPYTGSPILTLSDAGYSPYAVAVSSTGVVAVVNLCNAPSCATGSGSVNFYAKNSTMPCATLTDPYLTNMFGGTFDGKGRLYISAQSFSGPAVIGKISGGCKAKKITLLTTNNPIGVPGGGIHVDKLDRIAIWGTSGSSNSSVIETFRQPKMGSLGKPVSITPLTSTANYCSVDFAFRASGRKLYVGDGCGKAVEEYDFPLGGTAKKTITFPNGAPYGVAVTPPLVP